MQSRQQSIEIRLILLGLFLQRIQQLKLSEYAVELPRIIEDYLDRQDNEEFIKSLESIEGNLEFQLNLVRELVKYLLDSIRKNIKTF